MTVAPLLSKPPVKIAKSPNVGNKLKKLPLTTEPLPFRLQFLLSVQKGVSIITFCLVGTTLGMYAWTVYFPKVWSSEYKKLETLQRYERHLTSTNESLKNQLAQQAEKPEAGLSNPNPTQSIFLKPTSETLKHPPGELQHRLPSSNGDRMPVTRISEGRRSLANAY